MEKSRLERIASKRSFAAIGVIGTLLLAGCSSTEAKKEKASQPDVPAEVAPKVNENLPEKIQKFTNHVEKSGSAEIALGACVALSMGNATLVIANPGVTHLVENGKRRNLYIGHDVEFGGFQSFFPRSESDVTLVSMTGEDTPAMPSIQERNLNYSAKTGYEDAATGQPVMRGILMPPHGTDDPVVKSRQAELVCSFLLNPNQPIERGQPATTAIA